MTYTVNGIGTHLSGKRKLNTYEINMFRSIVEPQLDYTGSKYRISMEDCKIATVSFCALFIPIIPLYTIIIYDGDDDDSWICDNYIILHRPGKYKLVYWDHVLKSFIFYIFPLFIIYLFINR